MVAKRTATSKAVANALGVSTATVQAYARSCRIPFSVTPGGHRRFDVAEVQVALAPAGGMDGIVALLTPLSQRDLAFGSTLPNHARLAEMAELTGSRPEGLASAATPQSGSAADETGRSALWQLLRCARTPHPDAAEGHVLGKAAAIVAKHAREALTGGERTLQYKLVNATDTWLVRCSELTVTLCPVLTLDRAKAAGMLVKATGNLDTPAVAAASRKLANEISAAITRDSGYRVNVEARTWESMTAGEFTDFALWVWEDQLDPLLDETPNVGSESFFRMDG